MTLRDPIDSIWADALRLLDLAERLQRRSFRPGGTVAVGPRWEPPADVYETADDLTILIALPGVAPDRLDILVDGGMLIVIGERPPPRAGRAKIHRLEIPYGRFERRIDLPPGHYEVRERELRDGCLLLNLGKLT
ncbi:MAG TPA: Hsp20/alpha crystallin family protein [Noviherbaspirillum sp.]